MLVVRKLDRFCRTTKEGLQHIDSLMNKGVKIHILNMGCLRDGSPRSSFRYPFFFIK